MNPNQQQAMRRISRILQDNFSHALVSAIYRDEVSGRHAIVVIDGTANNNQALDLAQRTVNQIEIKVHGFIKTAFDVPLDIKNGRPRA